MGHLQDKRDDEVYTDSELTARLQAELPLWQLDGGAICRRFDSGDWLGAMALANAIAPLAEAAWHHPELTLSFGAVVVRLWTHSAKGVTAKDFALAAGIDEVARRHPPPAR